MRHSLQRQDKCQTNKKDILAIRIKQGTFIHWLLFLEQSVSFSLSLSIYSLSLSLSLCLSLSLSLYLPFTLSLSLSLTLSLICSDIGLIILWQILSGRGPSCNPLSVEKRLIPSILFCVMWPVAEMDFVIYSICFFSMCVGSMGFMVPRGGLLNL